MTQKIEEILLGSLISDDAYARQVLPFLDEKYFHEKEYSTIFTIIRDHFAKYNKAPDKSIIGIKLEDSNLLQKDLDATFDTLDRLEPSQNQREWLLESTETFCRDQALYNEILAAVEAYQGKGQKEVSLGAIPDKIQKALAISFDSSVGHDYYDDAASRYDYYHQAINRIPCDIDMFNTIMRGGVPPKTLNVFLMDTNVGKTLSMTHLATSYLKQGKNVLYITMEMSQERISERIDCNLLDVAIDDLGKLSKDEFLGRVNQIKGKTRGTLVVKEYPTASAHVGHFKSLISELKLKKRFVPDVIFVDYINICACMRIKAGAGANSYTTIKAIAEELRALAVENNVPLWTATQVNRGGAKSSDISMTDTSESYGIPYTADFFIAASRSEEMDELGQIMFSQLKSRYGDINWHRRFVVGIDLKKFRLYNVDQSANEGVTGAVPRAGSSRIAAIDADTGEIVFD